MWWTILAWLIGVCVCLLVVGKLWDDEDGGIDKPWEKR